MSDVVHIVFLMGGKYYVRHTEEHLHRDRKFINTYRGVHMSVKRVVHIAEFTIPEFTYCFMLSPGKQESEFIIKTEKPEFTV
jgi:hypothetical protein